MLDSSTVILYFLTVKNVDAITVILYFLTSAEILIWQR